MNLYEDENAYYYSTLITCVPFTSRLANRLIWSTNELIGQIQMRETHSTPGQARNTSSTRTSSSAR